MILERMQLSQRYTCMFSEIWNNVRERNKIWLLIIPNARQVYDRIITVRILDPIPVVGHLNLLVCLDLLRGPELRSSLMTLGGRSDF